MLTVQLFLPPLPLLNILTTAYSWALQRDAHLNSIGLHPITYGLPTTHIAKFLSSTTTTFSSVSLPFYLALNSARVALQREYAAEDAASSLSLRMGGEIAGVLSPMLLYLSLRHDAGYAVGATAVSCN